ncbi:crossover junction endodeoxyribonuclease [Mesorhizobium phage Cp1R7A-A1]|nr:crossover junction endodeoxyribonuclease [Mesorhizobium phage Cp1R7A-A1]
MSLILGLDPGVNGALAFLDIDTWALEVIDAPKIETKIAGSARNHVDHGRLARLIRVRKPTHLVTEKLWSRPGQDSKSTFTLGRYLGHVEMAASMLLECTLMQPTPQEWKGDLHVSADKSLSRDRAIQLIPALEPILTRKGDHDRGEAAMLAFWGALKLGKLPGAIRLINPPDAPKRKKAA